MGSTDRLNRPVSILENSSSSSTMRVRRCASDTMMAIPFFTSDASRTSPLYSVSAQPLMAVRGVRSSWDTEEINSDWVRSAWSIFMDISLMASTRSPISSLERDSICTP